MTKEVNYMTSNELWLEILRKESEIDRNRLKRSAYTVLFYTVVFTWIAYSIFQPDGNKLWAIFCTFLLCIIPAAISFLFNVIIFGQLTRCSNAEDYALKALKKKYDEACEKEELEKKKLEKGSGKNDSVPNE